MFVLPNIDDEKTILKTIRINIVLYEKIANISKNTNISINRVINECIKYALDNYKE